MARIHCWRQGQPQKWLRYSVMAILMSLLIVIGFGRAPALAVTPVTILSCNSHPRQR